MTPRTETPPPSEPKRNIAIHGYDNVRGLVNSPLKGNPIVRCACGRPEYFRGKCFKHTQEAQS